MLTALPWDRLTRATVPEYIIEQGGLVWYDATRIKDSDDPPDSWHLRVVTPSREIHYWINPQTYEVIRAEHHLSHGRTLIYRLAPSVHGLPGRLLTPRAPKGTG